MNIQKAKEPKYNDLSLRLSASVGGFKDDNVKTQPHSVSPVG